MHKVFLRLSPVESRKFICMATHACELMNSATFSCRVHAKLRLTEKREGASFQALFGSVLLLGMLSRRRVYFEAIKYEKERNGGFLSPFGYSTITVAAAINTVSSVEVIFLKIHF